MKFVVEQITIFFQFCHLPFLLAMPFYSLDSLVLLDEGECLLFKWGAFLAKISNFSEVSYSFLLGFIPIKFRIVKFGNWIFPIRLATLYLNWIVSDFTRILRLKKHARFKNLITHSLGLQYPLLVILSRITLCNLN